jgi:hypothetical protein
MGSAKERLHITLRPGLKRAAKLKALQEGTSVSAVIEGALERWVSSWSGFGRELCSETTGHNKTWPKDLNGVCPVCGREFLLSDRVTVVDGVVYHQACRWGGSDGD